MRDSAAVLVDGGSGSLPFGSANVTGSGGGEEITAIGSVKGPIDTTA